MADPKNTKPSGDSPSLSTDLLSAVAMNLMSQAEGQMTEAEEMQAAGKSKEAWRACTAARCLRLASRAVREVADNTVVCGAGPAASAPPNGYPEDRQ